MSKPVIIVADSACDLSPQIVEQYNIKIIPMNVTLETKSFRDGIDLVPDDIYANYQAQGTLPKTAAISVGQYLDFFRPFVEQGNDVVYISISSGFSANVQNAEIAAQELQDIYVVDSLNLSTGIGHVVLVGAELRDQGLEGKLIAERLRSVVPRVRASFVLDTLEFLHKGGRCSSLAALGANLLKLKPGIEVSEGKMHVGKKYRGKLETVLGQYVKEKLENNRQLDLHRVFITHSGISEAIIAQVEKAIRQYASFEEILITRAGCTISSHCGPNTLGVLFIVNE